MIQTDLPIDAHNAVERMGLSQVITDPVLARLGQYLTLLLEANQRFNLTAMRDRDAAWQRLILESLTLIPCLDDLPPITKLIDIGSGGGVPGLPVAIAMPHLRVTLLEATGKKAKFLKQCATQLALPNVHVIHSRAETLGHDPTYRSQYEAAVCRGVGPMNRVLEYMLPLVRGGGYAMAIKGQNFNLDELNACQNAIDVLGGGDMQVFEPPTAWGDQAPFIVSVLKDRRTPNAYPRRPGVPARSPL